MRISFIIFLLYTIKTDSSTCLIFVFSTHALILLIKYILNFLLTDTNNLMWVFFLYFPKKEKLSIDYNWNLLEYIVKTNFILIVYDVKSLTDFTRRFPIHVNKIKNNVTQIALCNSILVTIWSENTFFSPIEKPFPISASLVNLAGQQKSVKMSHCSIYISYTILCSVYEIFAMSVNLWFSFCI